ncbi:MAG: hypothetical protein GY866_15825 [Proteobacteria bacterium]|nr:hypothetical protein [Pseudomonadota bacterium]
MEQKIKILGLGIKSSVWRKLCKALKEGIDHDRIELESAYLGKSRSGFPDKAFEMTSSFEPDALFTATSSFKSVEGLDRFLQRIAASEPLRYPNVVLIEKEPDRFFKEYSTENISIYHVLSERELKKRTADFESFLFKMREHSKYRLCQDFNDEMSKESATVKANTPITICTDYPVINMIFYNLLKKDGYEQVTTTDQRIDQSDRFLLNISSKSGDDELFCKNLLLETNVFDIPAFPKVTEGIYSQPVSSNESCETSEIQAERKRIIRKTHKLNDQIKNLSSSKALADQEKYMNLVAGRKLDILMALLDIAEIWDEQNHETTNLYEENVLIFYDDNLQATLLNKKLKGEGKKLFVDVAKEIDDLKMLMTLNTDYLEPFLHEGIIVCCTSSKTILVRKFQQFQLELSQKKHPELSEGINALRSEKRKCRDRLIELAYLEAWNQLKSFYLKNSDAILQSARKAKQAFDIRKSSRNRIRNLGVFSMDSEQCYAIETALTKVFSGFDHVRFHPVFADMELVTSLSKETMDSLEELHVGKNERATAIQKELARQNAQQLSLYFNHVLKKLSVISVDLLIVEHDFELLNLLIKNLRQRKSLYRYTPILAVFSGPIHEEKMIELAHQGVKILYRDRFEKSNNEYFVESLKTVFSS